MPYELHRVGRNLVVSERPDGSTVLQYTDEIEISQSIKIVMEREVRDILSRTRKFDEFVDDQMSAKDKLQAIMAATSVVGPIPPANNPDDDTSSKMVLDAMYWHWILNVAENNLWVPKGTTGPLALPSGNSWDGSYTILAGQSIDREDTASMCRALKVALEEGSIGEPCVTNYGDDAKQILSDFINFCDGGYMLMVW